MVKSDGSVYTDEFITYVNARGYRSIGLEIRINMGTRKENVILHFNKRDAEEIMTAIKQINEIAWSKGRPIDADPGEQIPEWV
jgi:hypothetical protein